MPAAAAAASTVPSGVPSNTPAPRSRSSGRYFGAGSEATVLSCGGSLVAICSVSVHRARSEQYTAPKRVRASRGACAGASVSARVSAAQERRATRAHQRSSLRAAQGRQRAGRLPLRDAGDVLVREAVPHEQHTQHSARERALPAPSATFVPCCVPSTGLLRAKKEQRLTTTHGCPPGGHETRRDAAQRCGRGKGTSNRHKVCAHRCHFAALLVLPAFGVAALL